MSVSLLEEHENPVDFLYAHTYFEETSQDVWEYCVIPSALSIFHIFYKIILTNLFFGIIITIVKLPPSLYHIFAGGIGIYLINNLESLEGKCLILIIFMKSYLLLQASSYIQTHFHYNQYCNKTKVRYLSTSNIMKYTLIIVLIVCEYFLLKTEAWMEARGVIMIFSMKLISLAEDIDKGAVKYPSFLNYFGYMFCGANVMFGPWTSFNEYIALYNQTTNKNIWWILGIIRALTISVFFLMISNCWSTYFIPDESNRWLISYREAMSFRTSHYFISFLSEASMLAAGFKSSKIWHEPKKWRYEVVDPIKTEFPTALAIVVTRWNRPMHEFLKKYVYRSWLPHGKFFAILATFIVSSLLHGFELKVSVVLISIGIFSYLQFTVRGQFAKAFNSCINVYPCKEPCRHRFKRNSIFSWMCRLLFSFTTIVHLIFLGMLMDPNTDEIGIFQKWNNLYFISFWIMLVNILLIM
ncbi:protein-serine O-palmitoleoyltransferase porcupine [Diabrotica undecimpunctata]|uniref:protein-serine O-palmitoleoyltransferase porcupine n=1 Tax=Diabrotica undecimpunctata TaxID=50387 RepID=UPI003B632DEC